MENSETLRPLSAGEILDRAIRLYRNNFSILVGIVSLAFVPTTALQIISQIAFLNTQLVSLFINGFVLCLVQGSLAFALSSAYLGKSFSISSSYRIGLSRYGSLWGAQFLQGLAIGFPAILLGIVLGLSGGGCIIPFVILFIPYVVFLSTRWLITFPSIMYEELGASEGLRRSWNLTDTSFWRILGISILSSLLSFFVAQLPGMLIAYVLALIFPETTSIPVVEVAITGVSQILAFPLSMGILVTMYFDLRIRQEGFDLQFQAALVNK